MKLVRQIDNLSEVNRKMFISPFTAVTGRVKNFIEDVNKGVVPEKMVFPSSCTVYKYDNDLQDILEFSSGALRKGAGVKIQLEGFKKREPLNNPPNWYFMFDKDHPDFPKLENLPESLQKHYLTVEEYEQKFLLCDRDNYVYLPVADSMEEGDERGVSIQRSWMWFVATLENGDLPIVDLSQLRPAGTPSSNRLVATGALGMGDPLDKEAGSFVSLYDRLYQHVKRGDITTLLQLLGQLNRTLRQGRDGKTGIICTAMRYDCPDFETYLKAPLSVLVGSQKRGVRIDEGVLESPVLDLIIEKVNTESLFLEKIEPVKEGGEQLYSNVCTEILLPHRGTCLLSHVNAGALTKPEDIVFAMIETTTFLCKMWCTWRDKVPAKYAELFRPLHEDRQIGVGWLGWANFLASQGVKYSSHAIALQRVLDAVILEGVKITKRDLINKFGSTGISKAEWIAIYLVVGYMSAAEIARKFGLERAFTMAPTQSAAFEYTDLEGNVCSRAIDPPFNRRTRRDSNVKDQQWVFYGKKVETANEVGAEVHQLQWDQWQRLMDLTGMAHTMSYDLWQEIDRDWMKWFIKEANLKTTYYNFHSKLDQSYLNKGRAMSAIATEAASCDISAASEGMACGCAE